MQMAFQTEHSCITIDTGKELIVVEWWGFAPPEEHRQVWHESIDLVKKHKLKRWLIDLQDASLQTVEEIRWTYNEWYPQAIEQVPFPFRVAILPFRNAFGELTLQVQLNKKVPERGLVLPPVRYFQDEEEALQWLFEDIVL
jgi:hypothetical protein